MLMSNRVAHGTGSLERTAHRSLTAAWRREAGRPTRAMRATSTAVFVGMGIGVRTVVRGQA